MHVPTRRALRGRRLARCRAPRRLGARVWRRGHGASRDRAARGVGHGSRCSHSRPNAALLRTAWRRIPRGCPAAARSLARAPLRARPSCHRRPHTPQAARLLAPPALGPCRHAGAPARARTRVGRPARRRHASRHHCGAPRRADERWLRRQWLRWRLGCRWHARAASGVCRRPRLFRTGCGRGAVGSDAWCARPRGGISRGRARPCAARRAVGSPACQPRRARRSPRPQQQCSRHRRRWRRLRRPRAHGTRLDGAPGQAVWPAARRALSASARSAAAA
mmetsp:Transcript_10151/g.33497  ORF Transcript_10151/g.33497 Transcript_10151/m.33497 type:complete len:278 (+) Transcript_10151:1700-2533(+)